LNGFEFGFEFLIGSGILDNNMRIKSKDLIKNETENQTLYPHSIIKRNKNLNISFLFFIIVLCG
jgi:hypothetical protein